MTPNLPQKLWRPLSEVKSYVEKFPDGVFLADVKNRVGGFKTLKTKEQSELLEFIRSRENILVLPCKKVNAKRTTMMLRHKKFGFPKVIPGYVYPVRDKNPEPQKPIEIKKPEVKPMTLDAKASPEALRKQAEELLKAAEKAEREANENDLFNKKLAPVKLEILQSVGAVQRKFDELMDCMGTLEKAAQKLKEISA